MKRIKERTSRAYSTNIDNLTRFRKGYARYKLVLNNRYYLSILPLGILIASQTLQMIHTSRAFLTAPLGHDLKHFLAPRFLGYPLKRALRGAHAQARTRGSSCIMRSPRALNLL
jgi:hypothetical protein